MDGLIIREAREADISAIAAMFAADDVGGHGDTTDEAAMTDYLAAFRAIAMSTLETLYVAEFEGEVIGQEPRRSGQPVDQKRHPDEQPAAIAIGQAHEDRRDHQIFLGDLERAEDRAIEGVPGERIRRGQAHHGEGGEHANVEQREFATVQQLSQSLRHTNSAEWIRSFRGAAKRQARNP